MSWLKHLDDVIVGYINKNGVLTCEACTEQTDPVPVKVFGCNLRPYRQTCHKCKEVVYPGSCEIELFPFIEPDSPSCPKCRQYNAMLYDGMVNNQLYMRCRSCGYVEARNV